MDECYGKGKWEDTKPTSEYSAFKRGDTNMDHVYIVQHAYETPEGVENIKLIGVYSCEEKAKDAIARLSTKPGFCEHVDSFSVNKLTIDKDQWPDGFVNWDTATNSAT